MRSRWVIAAVMTVVTFVATPAASAHVTVSADNAQQGGYGVLTFRVPTESPTASTTGLEVVLPEEHPIGSVSIEPTPGWAGSVQYRDVDPPITDGHGAILSSVPSKIVWTAIGPGVGPGEFGRFAVLAGPLPHEATVAFPTVQTYSDSSTAEWVQIATAGTEAESPAPALTLAAHGGDDHGAPSPNLDSSADTSPVEWIALAASVVALVLATFAVVRRRSTSG